MTFSGTCHFAEIVVTDGYDRRRRRGVATGIEPAPRLRTPARCPAVSTPNLPVDEALAPEVWARSRLVGQNATITHGGPGRGPGYGRGPALADDPDRCGGTFSSADSRPSVGSNLDLDRVVDSGGSRPARTARMAMAGADFVRADLHVHTIPDGAQEAAHPLDEYVRVALDRGVGVLGITDHNTISNVRQVIAAASGTDLLVLPGIETTTHEGHLLALFDPDNVSALEDLVAPSTLELRPDPRDGAMRSVKGMLELVDLISHRGGLAIPAHIDSRGGLLTSISSSGLASLLSSPTSTVFLLISARRGC